MLIFFGIFFPEMVVFFPLAGEEINVKGDILAQNAHAKTNVNFTALVIGNQQARRAHQAGYEKRNQEPGQEGGAVMKADIGHETDQDTHGYRVHAHLHIYVGDQPQRGCQEDAQGQLNQFLRKLRLVAQHIPHPEIKDATGYIGNDSFATTAKVNGVNKAQPFDQQYCHKWKEAVDHKKANQRDPFFSWRETQEIRRYHQQKTNDVYRNKKWMKNKRDNMCRYPQGPMPAPGGILIPFTQFIFF